MHHNLLLGSATCIVIATMFWIAGYSPTLPGHLGIKLLLGGGWLVPAAGALLAMLGFARAGRFRRWAVACAALNIAFFAAYWMLLG